ncbi:MarR family transcriptional regulator [Trebonia kvetii]|uniref:MarR family transcriptional regulator n=1 Tax=Trebonia kvetii TaxID=2480626 RepID=A0A6P2BRI7_9ACTN|nr:MarR family winged helix-turn-helix transcriptional regulator [Trebonia kvetii]TVZ01570.1 MarR family transcriptional regulator [Trebonia kvetii]
MTDVVTDDGAEPEPYRHTGYLLRRAQQLHVATWARIVSTDISTVQYSILVVLDRAGELSQRELCDEVDLDRSTMADLVARMERHGLIARRRDPADARRKTVALTDHGLAERMRLQPLVDQVEDALTGAFKGPARDCLRDTLRMMLAQQDSAAR